MFCPSCGKQIADNAKFCEFCGIKVSKTRNNKKVDIRWALLPPMVISIFAIYIALEAPSARFFIHESILLLAIPPIILFIISLVNGIKKALESFFVIIMGILLACACLELFAWVEGYYYANTYCIDDRFSLSMGISIISLIIYTIYAFIKHKKSAGLK